MKKHNKFKTCSNFKPINEYVSHYHNMPSQNCNECIYFCSKNCGYDVTDVIENDFEYF